MHIRFLAPVVFCAALSLGLGPSFAPRLSTAAAAFDNASSHQQARYGSKTCMVTHSHYGKSKPWISKKGAQDAAIRDWRRLVLFEYGEKWGSYQLTRGKRMSCSQEGSKWVCETNAYPCRR